MLVELNSTNQANYQNQIIANFEQISQECGNFSFRILLLQQLETYDSGSSSDCRGVRSRLFWTPAPVLTNQTPDPAPCLLFILLLLFDSCFYAKRLFRKGNGQIVPKTILPQCCNCSVVCNISKYLEEAEKDQLLMLMPF